MEPGHEDREYGGLRGITDAYRVPQWSPVMKTGNTPPTGVTPSPVDWPQWSPVMKTGNTQRTQVSEVLRQRLNGARS